jgi:hypothetical protein
VPSPVKARLTKPAYAAGPLLGRPTTSTTTARCWFSTGQGSGASPNGRLAARGRTADEGRTGDPDGPPAHPLGFQLPPPALTTPTGQAMPVPVLVVVRVCTNS